MRVPLLMALAIACIWDAFTTVYGTNHMLTSSSTITLSTQQMSLIVSALFGLVLLLFLLSSSYILDEGANTFARVLLAILLPIAFAYDAYTSFIGNAVFFFGQDIGSRESPLFHVWGGLDGSQKIILIGISFFISACPLLFSLIVKGNPSAAKV